jgi:putative ABC transport system permease protein
VVGALGVVAVTAWVAAAKAGLLRTVDAIAVGRTPRPGRGQWAARLTSRLPLPRPVSLGLAHPFARPLRAAAMLAAIVFGVSTVTFAVGVASSLSQVEIAKDHAAADVIVHTFGPRNGEFGPSEEPTAADLATIAKTIEAQPGTGRSYSSASTELSITGITGSVQVELFTGDASWGGYQLVSGSWFARPGEAVVPTGFLTDTGTQVGDTVMLNDHGTATAVKIVGELFHPTDELMVFTDAATLTTTESDLRGTEFHIAVAAGTDVNAYLTALNSALDPSGFSAELGGSRGGSDTVIILNSLSALLTLMLATVAGLGVLNLVVLDTRERVHDLGVHKALGMTPRQTISMVIATVVVLGLVGGAIGAGAGVALQSVVVPAMGSSSGLTLPPFVTDVYQPTQLVLLGLSGVLIAVLGALLPAGWAARTRTATALRTE